MSCTNLQHSNYISYYIFKAFCVDHKIAANNQFPIKLFYKNSMYKVKAATNRISKKEGNGHDYLEHAKNLYA